jgi:hypothetical protein
MNRRTFLKHTGAAAGVAAAHNLEGATQGVSIIVDPGDPVASAPPPAWAVRELKAALANQGLTAQVYPRLDAAPDADRRIVIAGGNSATAREILQGAKVSMPSSAEALCLVPGKAGGKSALLVGGSDARGLVYAVLELADRVKYGDNASAVLDNRTPVVEKPANVIRSCARCFVSPVEDKAWFYDRDLWVEYLSTLAAHRFNRFNLTFGIGYNSARDIPDSYFYLAYPFLLPVPGYNVTATGLPDAERDRNLQTLRFISEQTVARGIQFNLALWSHAYEWPNRETNYRIAGLTPQTHAPYCRDGLAALLKACPKITGLSVRMHGESGIPDGDYEFWETLFQAIKPAGRRIDLDLHAKGTDQRHIDIALATGMPVSMAPKFWAEHMGMPYHQAAIREEEMRPAGPNEPKNAATTRRFLRYGYGDYMKEDRNYGIIHRIWPGTQRHLLWGDPAMAAGYGYAFSFAGSLGVELFEPLSFKGRMGSGLPGGRNAYADKSLDPKYDWQKFNYQYRVWGRMIYNPQTDPEGWRRYLRRELQAAAPAAEIALANASRVLPVITTTHGASGSNNSYWPEMYMNMPIVDPNRAQPYRDTPEPRKFGTVGAFDPQMFSSVEDCAEALVSGKSFAKYSPLDVAQWLEDMSEAASANQAQALAHAPRKDAPELRRLMADVAIQSGIGKFFAYKFRSAILWSLYERTGDRTALTEAVKAYRTARQAWASMAEMAKTVYLPDITYGLNANMRGHWFDRIAGIDGDLGDMEKRLTETSSAPAPAGDPAVARRAIATVLARPERQPVACSHTPEAQFEPGKDLELSLSFQQAAQRKVNLLYRQADQSQRWRSEEMQERDREFRGIVPAGYTQSPYPLLYYFEVQEPAGSTIYPGFCPDLSNQPYFVVRSVRRKG